MLKIYLIFTVIIGGVIDSFIRQSKGTINKFHKLIGRIYITIFLMSLVAMKLKYGMIDAIMLIGLFTLSVTMFNLIFGIAFHKMK